MSKTSTDRDGRLVLRGPTMAARYEALAYPAAGQVDAAALQADLAAALEAVEQQMSGWRPDSDLNRLNAAAPGQWLALPDNLLVVLAAGLQVGAASGGAFDMALGDLVSAWGFGPPVRQPDEAAIRALTGKPRQPCAEVLQLAPGRARRLAAVRFDLCGIAKGFGVDEMARVMRAHGICDYLVGIDGELRASGRKPGGAPWTVALERPNHDNPTAAGTLALDNCAIATSGDYRNYVRVGQARLGHIMHPGSARPVQNGVAAVSVLAPSCMLADAWATALTVLGAEAGAALARQLGLDVLFQLREAGGIRPVAVGRFA